MPFDTAAGDFGDFSSILSPFGPASFLAKQPGFLADLNLDQVIDAAVAGDDPAVLSPVFWTACRDEATVRHRQEIFADLDRPALGDLVAPFRVAMRRLRATLDQAGKTGWAVHRDALTLHAAGLYCDAVRALAEGLRRGEPRSAGLGACARFLEAMLAEARFAALDSGVARCRAALAGVEYGLLFRGDTVLVRPRAGEPDCVGAIHARFARFREADTPPLRPPETPDGAGLDHVEAEILARVARLFPGPFGELRGFVAAHPDFIDPVVARLDRELGFYSAWLGVMAPLQRAGLAFCTPAVSATDKAETLEGGFDVALAAKLVREGTAVVRNGYALSGAERVLVVTGPNQGGKTTFARMVGQVHHLAALGCPVPGTRAALFLPDAIFTHFERPESIATLRGRLEQELVDLHRTCVAMTADSLMVLNEVFNSTGFVDQVFLGTEVLARVLAAGAIGVCVTFIDALSTLGPGTVSMVGDVDPLDPATRTFRVRRRPADGLAHARALAERRGLDYPRLRARLGRGARP